MTNNPKTFYQLADSFGAWFGEPPVPRIEQVQRPVSIDLSQLTEQQLRWMAEAQEDER